MIEIVKKTAMDVGEMLLSLQTKKVRYKTKSSIDDLVTEGDIRSEQMVLKMIKDNFPSNGYISEESGKYNTDNEYVWVIDPVDGTTMFSAGLPTYAVSIGLFKNGKPHLGVVAIPGLRLLYWAEKGKGAYLNGKKINVSKTDKLENAIVGADWQRMRVRKEVFETLHFPFIEKVRYMPMLGAAVTGAALVASGAYDAYLHTAKIWDFCAAAIIVEEAGGRITDLKGKSIDWSQEHISIVASNGVIHSKILSEIQR